MRLFKDHGLQRALAVFDGDAQPQQTRVGAGERIIVAVGIVAIVARQKHQAARRGTRRVGIGCWYQHGRVGDPWVLDPTGEVSSRMRRLSELDWEPRIIFDETQRYRVVPAEARAGY